MLSTGPKSNPNKSSKIGSGMLVLLKNSSPKYPKTITSPATRNARTAGSKSNAPQFKRFCNSRNLKLARKLLKCFQLKATCNVHNTEPRKFL
jgi:hypothetical protein